MVGPGAELPTPAARERPRPRRQPAPSPSEAPQSPQMAAAEPAPRQPSWSSAPEPASADQPIGHDAGPAAAAPRGRTRPAGRPAGAGTAGPRARRRHLRLPYARWARSTESDDLRSTRPRPPRPPDAGQSRRRPATPDARRPAGARTLPACHPPWQRQFRGSERSPSVNAGGSPQRPTTRPPRRPVHARASGRTDARDAGSSGRFVIIGRECDGRRTTPAAAADAGTLPSGPPATAPNVAGPAAKGLEPVGLPPVTAADLRPMAGPAPAPTDSAVSPSAAPNGPEERRRRDETGTVRRSRCWVRTPTSCPSCRRCPT